MLNLLTVSGSLRNGSSNSTLLAAAALLAPAGARVSAYTSLASLPAFNPDIEEDTSSIPDAVRHWQSALASADAVLFSSPEYAHGIPGALKNALDWVVGTGELVFKRVGLLSASSASKFAHPQLVEVLTVMNATLVPEATLVIDVPRKGVNATALAADPIFAVKMSAALQVLLATDQASTTARPSFNT